MKYSPIIKDESLNLLNLWKFIRSILLKYKLFLIAVLAIYTIYFFIRPQALSAEVSFYTNYSESKNISNLSVLGSLAGIESDQNDLEFSVENYLNSDRFLNDIVAKSFNIDDEKIILKDYWGKDYNKIFAINPINFILKINRNISLINSLSVEDKKILYAKEKLRDSINYSENRKTFLHSINITLDDQKNAELASQIVNEIFNSILGYSIEVTSLKAKEKKQFITGRLIHMQKDLVDSEERMKIFLEKNKNISSPSLILQRQRIERDIALYTQLYLSLSDQLELAKIEESNTTSSVFLLDKPQKLPYKAGGSLLENLTKLIFLLLSIFFFYDSFRSRKELFH